MCPPILYLATVRTSRISSGFLIALPIRTCIPSWGTSEAMFSFSYNNNTNINNICKQIFLYIIFMKIKLKPLRGKKYYTEAYGDVKFIEVIGCGTCKVVCLATNKLITIPLDDLPLPIIDTKDYEKIEDTKYKGD